MLVLGIETTCDETSCALVRDGSDIVSQVISSQMDLHQAFGGVVPELACRRHIDVISTVLQQALTEGGCTLTDVDLIAAAYGPGLIGALLIGITYAKGLAWAHNIPLVGVNHIEAHLYAAIMSANSEQLEFPALGVVLSGGHTSLVLIHEIGRYTLIGQTVDDAIGEAFDKVAKILDLGYPGGPEIERLARQVSSSPLQFRAGQVKTRPLDFSFSGIKTNVLYTVRGNDLKRKEPVTENEKKAIAFAFQQAVFQDVVEKIQFAIKLHPVKAIFLGGGVTLNKELQRMLKERVDLPTYFPRSDLCMDNAAMIAGLGFHSYAQNKVNMLNTLQPETRIPF